ncbi:hypothetical protein [Ralstonia pseudosolanacearum]|uniref:hypothetical protein n=1 Tax=Ralstonia pseudosolanacearum TaxID=1310165 RepID=UPI003CF31841
MANKTSRAEERTERFDAGVAAANAVLSASDAPIFLRDEVAPDMTTDAYAMGWNSVWASDENQKRWAGEKPANAQ